jgi:hypothetical protein
MTAGVGIGYPNLVSVLWSQQEGLRAATPASVSHGVLVTADVPKAFSFSASDGSKRRGRWLRFENPEESRQ